MKNYKGYSLAELLVSIAIFSIVMLGIVSIMRTASISYRNENTEVNLQENAQVLLTQVEEMLVDCNACNVSGAPNEYTITDYQNKNHVLKVVTDSTGLKKWVEYSYDGSDFEVLAEDVDSLIIDKGAAHDNRCFVEVKMLGSVSGKNDGAKSFTYNASKEVVFRNDVEEASYRDDEFLNTASTTTTTTTTGNDNAMNVIVARYQLVNLRAEYNIDPDLGITISGTGASKYMFVDESYLDSDNYMTSIHESTTPTGYFTTSSEGNTDTESEFSCTINAKKVGGTPITLNIATKKVQLLPVPPAKGIVFAPRLASNDGVDKNFMSYVDVSGISIRDMREYYPTKYNLVKAKVIFKKNGSDLCRDIDDNGTHIDYETAKRIVSNRAAWNSKQINNVNNTEYNPYGQFYLTSEAVRPQNTNMQCNYSLCYDDFSDDHLCIMFGNGLYPNDPVFDGGNFTVEITLTYPWQTSTKDKTGIYKLYTGGSTLTNATN